MTDTVIGLLGKLEDTLMVYESYKDERAWMVGQRLRQCKDALLRDFTTRIGEPLQRRFHAEYTPRGATPPAVVECVLRPDCENSTRQ